MYGLVVSINKVSNKLLVAWVEREIHYFLVCMCVHCKQRLFVYNHLNGCHAAAWHPYMYARGV